MGACARPSDPAPPFRPEPASAPPPRLPRGFVARALTFEELAAAATPSPSGEAGERARHDLDRFFTTANRQVLERFLAHADRSEAELIAALATRAVDRSVAEEAPWYRLLAAVLATPFLEGCDPAIAGAEGLRAPHHPFLAWADARIAAWRRRHPGDWDCLRPALLSQLSALLTQLTFKAFVLEAEILRMRSCGDGGAAPASAERLFERRVRERPIYLRTLWLRYAGLARLAATAVLQWHDNLDALFRRLAADAEAIGAAFGIRADRGPCEIEGTLSDPHDGGSRVLVLRFADGERLVYKPRPVEVDIAFQRFLGWLNQAGLRPELRLLQVLPRDRYGWIEFVAPAPLPSLAAAGSFYQRHGALLAVLHALNGTDFHFENVIASGDQPVLVDLETLLHGVARRGPDEAGPSAAERKLTRSVFGSGLLPGWGDGDLLEPSPDLSGMGAREGQFYRNRNDVVEHREDGSVRVARRRLPIPVNPNRPTHRRESVDPAGYGGDVIRGFAKAYRILEAEKAALGHGDGPLAPLLDATVRHVPLGTIVYSSLLRRALHPDFLGRAIHRELIFAILAFRGERQPAAAGLLATELAALLRSDVPKFLARPDSRALFDGEGRTISDYLEETPAAALRTRLASLSADDRAFQQEIIRLAMATLARSGEPGAETAPPWTVDADCACEEEAIEEVGRIAGALCDQALLEGDEIGWIGIADGHHGSSQLAEVGAELYHGSSGIGLFLAGAGRWLGNDRWLDLSRRCARAALACVEGRRGMIGGGFSGRASAAYALLHLSGQFGERRWLDTALERLVDFAGDAAEDRLLDIVAGSAGLCAVLLAAFEQTGDRRLLEAAVMPAEHLLARRVECPTGCGWPSRNARAPLTGFSHGAAGIGWALLRLGHRLDREDLLEAGRSAFAYERSVYSREHGGWPDYRNLDHSPDQSSDGYSQAWCHGGPGIGLSRATLPRGLFGEAECEELLAAVRPMRVAPLAPSDCLCHGELGNAELLLAAAGALAEPGLARLARRRGSTAMRRSRSIGGWRCGGIPNEPIPGLLTGLAGIGYGLMRLYRPLETPPVLTIAPPIGTAAQSRVARSMAS